MHAWNALARIRVRNLLDILKHTFVLVTMATTATNGLSACPGTTERAPHESHRRSDDELEKHPRQRKRCYSPPASPATIYSTLSVGCTTRETIAHDALIAALESTERFDDYLARMRRPDGGGCKGGLASLREKVVASVDASLQSTRATCVVSRAREATTVPRPHPMDATHLSAACRFTDHRRLEPYVGRLRQVPRIVNVVTLANVDVMDDGEGRGLAFGIPLLDPPLNLQRMAPKVVGAFYAPTKFTALQLAFKWPRCRVLVFHTGVLVGTGTNGTASARTAIMLAQRQLAVEAGVVVRIRSFDVMNIVGAAALDTSVNCDAFADAHSDQAHFDKTSFVGMVSCTRVCCCLVHSAFDMFSTPYQLIHTYTPVDVATSSSCDECRSVLYRTRQSTGRQTRGRSTRWLRHIVTRTAAL